MIASLLLLSAQATAVEADAPIESKSIVVTASRSREAKDKSAQSVTVIDKARIERLGEPLVYSLLRLTPSAAVETSGPAGTVAEVRIRGAEANHTLLFIDGIRANDPASNDTPRFELLNADLASRIEIVRGPQSALWGSDAIGGVIAVNGLPEQMSGYSAAAEAGSFGFGRASASASLSAKDTAAAAAVGWQRATGIDSFDGQGDKDGYRNLSGRFRGSWAPSPNVKLGLSGFALSGRSEFDGVDPVTFIHADTLDSSSNRLAAARLWASAGDGESGLSGTVAASILGSSNRNFLDADEINRTRGDRRTANGQVQYRFSTGAVSHLAIVAVDADREGFHARDTIYGGASNQDRHRSHEAITGEWRAEARPLVLDFALRRDVFSSFRDSTTLRASALVAIGGGISIAGSYGEGIAQPTFFDLYGFFPGSFVGNPALKPERSRGFEASVRYRKGPLEAALTGYRQRLHDEIVDVFDPASFLSSTVNRATPSHRSGIEAELGWSLGDTLRLSANYAYLHATEPGPSAIGQVREVRRPKHGGSIALDGKTGRLTFGASLAWVGRRLDTNFDVFPAQQVRLRPYWLADLRVSYALRPGLDLFARGSNLLDARYQDVFGYRTEGRAIYAGFRLAAR